MNPTRARKVAAAVGLAALLACAAWLAWQTYAPGRALRQPTTKIVASKADLWTRIRADPGFFPVGVWYQSPQRLEQYRVLGVNLFVVTNGETTTADLDRFAASGTYLVPQRSPGFPLGHADKTVLGWFLIDEPDNAQPKPEGGYGPCLSADEMQQRYAAAKRLDPRPVILNLGAGVADPGWVGRGECTGQTDTYYPGVLHAGDIIGFDYYAVMQGERRLERVAHGVRNLRRWMAMGAMHKPLWVFVEAASIDGVHTPTATELRAQAWLAVINGARGIVWFPWQVATDGQRKREDELFAHPDLVEEVRTTSMDLRNLARVLNTGRSLALTTTGPASVIARSDGADAWIFVASESPKDAMVTLSSGWVGKRAIFPLRLGGRIAGRSDGRIDLALAPYGVALIRLAPATGS